ncbi:MAG: Gfo/Idh/MocA family oxidoreductase, partial [Planctomycetes bacterium]|nr:Gfo/Idh/MocA family oxidoreductase [Planctomycetota bacterium]
AQAAAFAAAHGAARAYGSYDEVLADPAVDVVYISLPNQLHAEWSIRCARAGKHVLCEKPATMDAIELAEVLAAARAADVFWYEAFAYRCHPRCERLRGLLGDGVIGEPRLAHATFSFDAAPLNRPRLWDPALGGGGLMDVGVYPLSWLRMVGRFAGCGEPQQVRALGRLVGGVDTVVGGVLSFAGGLVGTFTCGLECAQLSSAAVWGTRGWIEVVEPWKCPPGQSAYVIHRPGQADERVVDDDGLGSYAREALTVARDLHLRQSPACDWDDSRGQMAMLDELRRQLDVRWPDER